MTTLLPIVLDLDGTLVLTREANLMAYNYIGVSPPEDFHVRPWQSWCSKENHDLKGSLIHRFLSIYSRPTPLMRLLDLTRVQILTNASEQVVRSLCSMYPSLQWQTILHMTPDEKIAWLRRQPSAGMYFDDSEKTVQRVTTETDWVAVCVQFE